jgi:hypothetical protein
MMSRVLLLLWALFRALLLLRQPQPPAMRHVIKELLRCVGLGSPLCQRFGVAVGVHVSQTLRDRRRDLGKDAVGDEPFKGRFKVVIRIIFETGEFQRKR